MPNSDDAKQAYTAFLHTVKGIVDHRLNRIGSRAEEQHARNLTEPVFKALLGKAAVDAVVDAFHSLSEAEHATDWPEGRAQVVHDALLEEIRFFNARYKKFHSEASKGSDGAEGNGSGADDGADDAETVKGSLEDILGGWLPKWLKKLLKLLNEILSLIRPI